MILLWMIICWLNLVGCLAKLVMWDDFILEESSSPCCLGTAASSLAGPLGWYQEGEPVGFIASVVGAVILSAIYRFIVGRIFRNGWIPPELPDSPHKRVGSTAIPHRLRVCNHAEFTELGRRILIK